MGQVDLGPHNPQIPRYRVVSRTRSLSSGVPGGRYEAYIYTVRQVPWIVAAHLWTYLVRSSSLIYKSFETVDMSVEKHHDEIAPAQSSTESVNTGKVDIENDGEIFKRGEGIEDFRTVHWIHTSVIFLKRNSTNSSR